MLFVCICLYLPTGDAILLEGYPGQHGPPGGQVQNYAASEFTLLFFSRLGWCVVYQYLGSWCSRSACSFVGRQPP